MKATRKLIPALALLLVSAVLLSTASYAWFTTNTTVNATMNVQVSTPQNLQIKEATGSAWAYSLSLGSAGTLKPASSVDGATFHAVVGTTEGKEAEVDGIINGTDYSIKTDGTLVKGTADAGTELQNTKIQKLTDTAGYVVTKNLQLRAVNAVAAGDLYVSVGISNDASGGNVNNAVRVAITVGGVTEIFALGTTTDEKAIAADGKSIAAVTNGTETATAGEASKVETGSVALSGVTLAAGTATDVTVTVWYEGNDSDCIATQVKEGSNAAIEVRFSIF